jgi:hypothetical protein
MTNDDLRKRGYPPPHPDALQTPNPFVATVLNVTHGKLMPVYDIPRP